MRCMREVYHDYEAVDAAMPEGESETAVQTNRCPKGEQTHCNTSVEHAIHGAHKSWTSLLVH